MAENDRTLVMKNAKIIFRNFEGKEGQYNRAGDRNFCVLLDPETAEIMAKDGWNVKVLRSREEGDPEEPYIQVSVGFKGKPPKIVTITSQGRTNLNEDQCQVLDWVDIEKVDLIIRPYDWGPINGKSGTKAYLRSIFLTVEEDELDREYASVPMVGQTEED